MQAKSILMVLSAMALVTACANDETIEINYGESISLSAVAGKTTRYRKRSHHNQQYKKLSCIGLYPRSYIHGLRCAEGKEM